MQFDRSLVRRAACALVVVSCSIGTLTHADEPAGTQAAPDAAVSSPSNGGDKLVCKSQKVIGSNIPRRVCKTQSQIDAERESAQSSLGELNQSKGGVNSSTTGG